MTLKELRIAKARSLHAAHCLARNPTIRNAALLNYMATTPTNKMTTQLSLLDRDWCQSNAPTVLQAMRGREFTTDDLHSILPEPENVNLFGILVAKLRCSGLIERIGYRRSERKEANGRAVAVWRLKA